MIYYLIGVIFVAGIMTGIYLQDSEYRNEGLDHLGEYILITAIFSLLWPIIIPMFMFSRMEIKIRLKGKDED